MGFRKTVPPKGHSYHVPPFLLSAFPGAKRCKGKTSVQGGNSKRRRWIKKNKIYEWDYKKGTIEIYINNGKTHLGEFDHITGVQVGNAVPGRSIEK